MKKKLLSKTTLCVLLSLFTSLFFQPVFAGVVMIDVSDYQFTPASANLFLGDTVMWTWGNGSHTTTSTSIPSGAAMWDQPINSGSTMFMYIPTELGVYNYECSFHPTLMSGQFTVMTCPPPDYGSPGFNSVANCEGDSLFIDATIATAISYQWYHDGNMINGSTNAGYVLTASGIYFAIATNACGSDTSVITTLTLITNPSVSVIALGDSICTGNAVTLIANGASTYHWYSQDSTLSDSIGTSITANPSGNEIYYVSGTDLNGCNNSASITVIVIASSVPSFTFSQSGLTVDFTSTSTNATSYYWNFGDGTLDSIANPSHIFAANGNYTVELATENMLGCSDTITQNLLLSTSIADVNNSNSITINYNATASQLIVKSLEESMSLSQINVFDIAGKKMSVDFVKNGNSYTASTSMLSNGIYLVSIKGNETVSKKIIVQ